MKNIFQNIMNLPVAKDKISICSLIISFFSLIVAISFCVTAIKNLRKNTEALLINVRAQIYAGDRFLYDREYNDINKNKGKLNTIYANFSDKSLSISEYIKNQLKIIAPIDTNIIYGNVKTADELYDCIWGIDSYENYSLYDADELEAIRKVSNHIEQYFFHLATVFDYTENNVIPEHEWHTWRAWFNNVDLHPLLMMSLYYAMDEGYISEAFIMDLRNLLICDNSNKDENIRILKQFLGPRYGTAFISGHLEFLPGTYNISSKKCD